MPDGTKTTIKHFLMNQAAPGPGPSLATSLFFESSWCFLICLLIASLTQMVLP